MSQLRKQLNFHDSFRVEAVIEGPADTPYFGGKFRVKLTIGKDFPAAPPKGQLKVAKRITKLCLYYTFFLKD